MNVIFIGYRGSGKTSLGKIVARNLKRKFVDIDDVIVEVAGKSIPRIFAEHGEPHFRKLETVCIKKVCKAGNLVIAFGGGAVMNKENVKVAKETGKIILLIANPEVIYQRIKGDVNRPKLIKGVSELEEINTMLKKRAAAYKAAADVVVKSEGGLQRTAQRIVGILGEMGFLKSKKKLMRRRSAKRAAGKRRRV